MSSAGIAAVTQGMAAAESVSGKIGINLSNANTPGYKAFGNYLLSETTKYNGGVLAVSRVQADIQGEITETKNEFDYAIKGNGFFVVECNGERRYTNAGRFEKNKDGFLVAPNDCYLLGELYTDDNQEQKKGIEDPKRIQLSSSTIKGHETTTADINLKLSAQSPIAGGGQAQMTIDIANTLSPTLNQITDNDSFLMNFYQNVGDKSNQLSVTLTKKAIPQAVVRDGNRMTIEYSSIGDLVTKMENNLGQYFKSEPAAFSNDIKFELKENTRMQFEDKSSANILLKVKPQSIDSSKPTSKLTTISNKEFVKSWYNGNDANYNMASGKYSSSFMEEFLVIDSNDNSHQVFMNFIRTGFYEYTVEVSIPENEADPAVGKMIKSGKITFDPTTGKGTPTGLDSLTINFDVQGEQITSTFKLNWNKIDMYGDSFNGDITTDGKKEGALMNTSIDKNGNLTGHYSNGDDKLLAAIPLAIFKDPAKLQNEFGTVFSSNAESGPATLSLVGQNGAGTIVSGSLEGSNVDEATSMTDLMKQQRFYSFNAKAYGIMNGMEDVLLSVIHV
jgi:flagellar hook-basal body protein